MDTPGSPVDIELSDEQIRSLDIIYDVVKDRIAAQNTQISTLDTKAGFILGSASFLTTGVVAFQKTIFDISAKVTEKHLVFDWWVIPSFGLLTVAALVGYIVIVFSGFQAYKIRNLAAVSDVNKIRETYLAARSEVTKLMLVDSTRQVLDKNQIEINSKALWTQIGIISLIFEAAFIGLLIFVGAILASGVL